MPDTPKSNQVDAIMARLKQEFIETARDQLDDVEIRIDWLESGREIDADGLYDIQRNIHNIKGQGATFGFPMIGRIAHLLEDYLENSGGVRSDNIKDVRVYIDTMTSILVSGEHFTPDEAEALLHRLPTGKPQAFSDQDSRDVTVLLVMPDGVQRKVVAQELLSCGFNVNRTNNTMEAVAVALDLLPDIVFVNNDITPFGGRELAQVFNSIDRLKDTHFVLLTSYGQDDAHIAGLPENVSVVEKRRDYRESLGELLMEWGVFGKMAS